MKQIRNFLIVLATIALLSFSVFGEPAAPVATNLDLGSADQGSTTSDTQYADGGNNTELNATLTSLTDNWQIFYGNVSQQVLLRDSSANIAYDWGKTSPSGHIFFANGTGITWANLIGNEISTTRENENTALALGTANDNMSTFTAVETHPLINYTGFAGIAADSTYAVATKDGTAADSWDTALTWEGSDVAYCGFLNQATTAFNGANVDYQVMIPTADASTRQYFVYLAIE